MRSCRQPGAGIGGNGVVENPVGSADGDCLRRRRRFTGRQPECESRRLRPETGARHVKLGGIGAPAVTGASHPQSDRQDDRLGRRRRDFDISKIHSAGQIRRIGAHRERGGRGPRRGSDRKPIRGHAPIARLRLVGKRSAAGRQEDRARRRPVFGAGYGELQRRRPSQQIRGRLSGRVRRTQRCEKTRQDHRERRAPRL